VYFGVVCGEQFLPEIQNIMHKRQKLNTKPSDSLVNPLVLYSNENQGASRLVKPGIAKRRIPFNDISPKANRVIDLTASLKNGSETVQKSFNVFHVQM
jgi:hypothetical protein